MTITRVLASLLAVALLFAPVVRAQDSSSTLPAVRNDNSSPSPSAKNEELPDAPKPSGTLVFGPNGPPPAQGYKGPMPSRGFYKDGDYMRPRFGFRQVADGNFWTLAFALHAAASTFDAVSTLHAASLGHADANPLFGAHATPGRVAGIKLGVAALSMTGLYVAKKSDMQDSYEGVKRTDFPPRWWVMALFAPALYFAAGAHNATLGRIQPPK
jgi:hypothetical protein